MDEFYRTELLGLDLSSFSAASRLLEERSPTETTITTSISTRAEFGRTVGRIGKALRTSGAPSYLYVEVFPTRFGDIPHVGTHLCR